MRSSQKNAADNGDSASFEPPKRSPSTNKILGHFDIIDDYISSSPSSRIVVSDFFKSNKLSTSTINEFFTASRLGFEMMQPANIPLKNRSMDNYKKTTGNFSKSFHDIYKLEKRVKKDLKRISSYFFKQNKYDLSDHYMYEIEAAICDFYHFIAPDYAPTAKAIYQKDKDTIKYIGIAVKDFPGFKSTQDDPLTNDDLDFKVRQLDPLTNKIVEIDVLKYCSVLELEAIDEAAKAEGIVIDDKDLDKPIRVLLKQIPDSDEFQEVTITKKIIRNFRIVKGLAIGLTTSYAFEEDDNHTGNMSKDGKRIDFDMSLWVICFLFKLTGPVDWATRDPAGRFPITSYDIEHFPNLKDAKPFYWPTILVGILQNAFFSVASQVFNISRNAFRQHDIEIYRKLETNPIFIHYKYATFLKLILTNENHYSNISSMHIRKELPFQSPSIKPTSIIDLLSKHVGDRLISIKEELKKTPSFKDFMQEHGDKIIGDIEDDYIKYNENYKKKMDKEPDYETQLIDIKQVFNDYAKLRDELDLPNDPEIQPYIEATTSLRM